MLSQLSYSPIVDPAGVEPASRTRNDSSDFVGLTTRSMAGGSRVFPRCQLEVAHSLVLVTFPPENAVDLACMRWDSVSFPCAQPDSKSGTSNYAAATAALSKWLLLLAIVLRGTV